MSTGGANHAGVFESLTVSSRDSRNRLGFARERRTAPSTSSRRRDDASINMFPFRVVFIKTDVSAIGVSVGKRNFKLAIHRNRIKRQMREAARLYFWPIIEKSTENYLVMLIYTGKEKPKFPFIGVTISDH